MKNDLLFDFTVDKTAKTVFITREFAADLSLVWDAFTKKEILDQWWAANSLFMNTVFVVLSTVKSNSKSFFIFSVF